MVDSLATLAAQTSLSKRPHCVDVPAKIEEVEKFTAIIERKEKREGKQIQILHSFGYLFHVG